MQLSPVLIPDYLDTTDILLRIGPHEVDASTTGRWGERLSQGITRALAAALATQLPHMRVIAAGATQASARQLAVTVDALDCWRNGRCVLTAHWNALQAGKIVVGSAGQGSFASDLGAKVDDADIAAAMAALVDRLAGRIATGMFRLSRSTS